MVGKAIYGREAVFGWGKVGRTKVARTNDDRGKDVVPISSLHAKSYFSIFSHHVKPKIRKFVSGPQP